MDPAQWYVLGALACAFGAGWSVGRATPSWQLDEANEGTTIEDPLPRYGWGGWPWGGWGGWGWGWGYSSRYGAAGLQSLGGCLALGLGWLRGTGFAVLLLIGAGVLLWLTQVEPTAQVAPAGHTAGTTLLMHWRIWLALACAIGGYVAAVLTDKGPVGPLE